jgi:hypothetical protein
LLKQVHRDIEILVLLAASVVPKPDFADNEGQRPGYQRSYNRVFTELSRGGRYKSGLK